MERDRTSRLLQDIKSLASLISNATVTVDMQKDFLIQQLVGIKIALIAALNSLENIQISMDALTIQERKI